MEAEILNQLVWIKWLFAIFLIAILIITGGAIASIGLVIWLAKEVRQKKIFTSMASQMLDKARYSELRALCVDRMQECPGDPQGFFYHAKASQRLGDLDSALASMRKAGELNPGWLEDYVEPFIAGVEASVAARRISEEPAPQKAVSQRKPRSSSNKTKRRNT